MYIRLKIILSVIMLGCFSAFAQDNPYEIYGHKSNVVYETRVSDYLYIKNKDTISLTKAIAFNIDEGVVLFLGRNDTVLSKVKMQPEQLLHWLSPDPKATKLPSTSPYSFCVDNPIMMFDPDGQFPILVNGRVNSNSERGSATYWSANILTTVSNQTGFKQSDFRFVDGDKGFWPGSRKDAGVIQGKVDAKAIYTKLKESIVDGKITEQLQFISHSRGAAFANGYTQSLSDEINNLAKKDGIGFAYGKDNIVEYSVNLAPHQSSFINYPNTGSKNVNISHIGDLFSGANATGNVINVQSIPEKDAGPISQHSNGSFNTELNMTLNILEKNSNKSQLLQQVKTGYENYDKNRTNGDKSIVTQGSK